MGEGFVPWNVMLIYKIIKADIFIQINYRVKIIWLLDKKLVLFNHSTFELHPEHYILISYFYVRPMTFHTRLVNILGKMPLYMVCAIWQTVEKKGHSAACRKCQTIDKKGRQFCKQIIHTRAHYLLFFRFQGT